MSEASRKQRKPEVMSSGKLGAFLEESESVDHKQKKDLEKKTERKRDNKDKKKSEKTRELEESKGALVIRPVWFAVVGFILSMAALLYWFFLL